MLLHIAHMVMHVRAADWMIPLCMPCSLSPASLDINTSVKDYMKAWAKMPGACNATLDTLLPLLTILYSSSLDP
jgi:hypothetical protein